MSDIIESTAVTLSENNSLPVTKADLSALTEKRAVIRSLIKNELKEGVDFGVIPGTPAPTLYQPGAQKLTQLFGLRTEVVQVSQVIDHVGSFAMFIYKASVYHIRSGVKITECEASCNSMEKKYATRGVWKKNERGVSEKTQEPTPIYDIMNTIMKMAQKRALVGAVISATGASDFFTQDIDDAEDAQQVGIKPSGSINSGAPKELTVS